MFEFMDLLHKRYASPFSLLDNQIRTEQFSEWVEQFLKKTTEEENDRKQWEFFLHKVWDKSFSDWKAEMTAQASQGDVMDEAKKNEIIAKSSAILNNFVPIPQKEGEK